MLKQSMFTSILHVTFAHFGSNCVKNISVSLVNMSLNGSGQKCGVMMEVERSVFPLKRLRTNKTSTNLENDFIEVLPVEGADGAVLADDLRAVQEVDGYASRASEDPGGGDGDRSVQLSA